jgi:hypothetical protein
VNDSIALGLGREEWDDYRTFGFRLRAGRAPLAFLAALDSATFRGAAGEEALRADEAVIGFGYRLPRLEGERLGLEARLGGGLRLWGNLGQAGLQEAWHGVLGTMRDFPRAYLGGTAPEAYAWAALAAEFPAGGAERGTGSGLAPTPGADLALLALGSGAMELSASLRISAASALSTNYVYICREARLGRASDPEARLAAVEAGTWLGWGASTGVLAFENGLNLEAPFASCAVSLRSPPPRRASRGPPCELILGTNVLEPGFSAARMLVLGSRAASGPAGGGGFELHAGLEQRAGVTRRELPAGEDCHFQEGNLVLELFARPEGRQPLLLPFAGLAFGLRADAWYDRSLNQASILGDSLGPAARACLGLRLDSATLGPPEGCRLALDLSLGIFLAARAFPPPQAQLCLRGAVLDY